MKRLSEQISAQEQLSPEERRQNLRVRMQHRVDAYNASPGKLKDGYTISTAASDHTPIEGDGYDCPLCLNRGDTMKLVERMGGIFEVAEPCKCMRIRQSIWRMRRSGLEKSIRDYTFKRFTTQEPWQQSMLDIAQRYMTEGVRDGRWLYLGGQPGCGKTHICTAVAGKLLYERPLLYVVWPQISKRLKAIVNEADEYSQEIGKLQETDVLYIDDFFKPVKNDDGDFLPPTPADKKLAFEIINYRYINKLPTILSSEWTVRELTDIDEATGSRIAERSTGFCMAIGRDKARNHRLNGEVVV